MTWLASLSENAPRLAATAPRLQSRSSTRHLSHSQCRSHIPACWLEPHGQPLLCGLTFWSPIRPSRPLRAAVHKPSAPVSRVMTAHTSRRLSSSTSSPAAQNQPTGFTYKLAAAYCGKAVQFDPSKHYFSFDSHTSSRMRAGQPIDKNELLKAKRLSSGQDACFVTTVGHTEAVAFGVADGVGGWQEQGIDSADFAHGICMYMDEAATHYQHSAPTMSPLDLLRTGYDRVCNDRSIQGGGSTACIAVADGLGTLKVANLGDSGFMQLRLNKVHHYSDPQTHAFNTPYQLSRIPPKILAQIEEFGGGAPFSDTPDDASVTTHPLQHGDVLVFGTDGVWDNLSSQDVLAIVSDRMSDAHAWLDSGDGTAVTDMLPHVTQQRPRDDAWRPLHELLAAEVVQSAKEASANSKRDGPFAKAFQRAFPEDPYTGGKPDDIAVVVVIALDPSFVPDRRVAAKIKSKL